MSRTPGSFQDIIAVRAQCDNRTMRLIDLSVPLQHDAPSEPLPAKIHYVTHDAEGLAQMKQFFGVREEDLVWSEGKGWAVEEIHAITHTGTHVDAPYHYGPLSEGKPARRIDEVPLEWCYAPGVIVDVRHLPAGAEITVDDLRQALERHRVHAAAARYRAAADRLRPADRLEGLLSRSRDWAATARCGWWSRACA